MMKTLTAVILSAMAMMFTPAHASQGLTAVTLGGQFIPSVIVIEHGQSLTFANVDTQTHSLTSFDVDANGNPLFDSGYKGVGQSGSVDGVSSLAANQTGYAFRCQMHSWMTGVLIVV